MFAFIVLAVPGDTFQESDNEDEDDPEERIHQRDSDRRRAHYAEYSDSEDEGDDRKDQQEYNTSSSRKVVTTDLNTDFSRPRPSMSIQAQPSRNDTAGSSAEEDSVMDVDDIAGN